MHEFNRARACSAPLGAGVFEQLCWVIAFAGSACDGHAAASA
ncbi:MAG: hypothetical protein NTV94_00735 [Planctomycetota bacterium]|nr:hypothetical protein [Planctomycetota bacterium]